MKNFKSLKTIVIVFTLLLLPICIGLLFMGILNQYGDSGDLSSLPYLFPFAKIYLSLNGNNIDSLLFISVLAQFPIYAAILAFVKSQKNLIALVCLLAAIHILAVFVAVSSTQ